MAETSILSARGGSFMFHPAGALPQFTPEESGEEARAIAEAARDFMNGEIMPRDEEIDRLNLELTRDLLAKAGDLGILGMEVPEAYGGLDLDKKTALLVLDPAMLPSNRLKVWLVSWAASRISAWVWMVKSSGCPALIRWRSRSRFVI